MAKVKLKPCPFCGYPAELIRDRAPKCWGQRFSYMVKCTNHRCSIHPQSATSSSRRGVVAAWDIRATLVETIPLRAILDWYMCSDPWPGGDQDAVTGWLDRSCKAMGYDSWVSAYHLMGK